MKKTSLMMYLAPSDRQRLETEAERDGLSTSAFLRTLLRRELTARERSRGGADQMAAA